MPAPRRRAPPRSGRGRCKRIAFAHSIMLSAMPWPLAVASGRPASISSSASALVAAVGGEHLPGLYQGRGVGRLGDRVGLLQQRRRFGVLPGVYVDAGAVAGRDGEDAERAGFARDGVRRGWPARPRSSAPTDPRRCGTQARASGRWPDCPRRLGGRPRAPPAAEPHPPRNPPSTRVARPFRSRSAAAGGCDAEGAARTTCSTSRPLPRRPAKIAAASASRHVSRASPGSSGTRRLAASSSNGGASLPRLSANTICARSRCKRARWSSSSGVSSAVATRACAASGAARLQLGLCRGQRSRPPACRIGGQLGRSLQERGRRRDAAATLRPVGRALELAGHRLVEARRRVRAMPCSPIGVRLGIRRLGQRAVHLPAVVRGRRRGRPPSAPGDDGTARGYRARSTRRPRPARPRRLRSRAARPRARAGRRRQPAPPPPSAAAVATRAGSD